jgi:hypothetical protein
MDIIYESIIKIMSKYIYGFATKKGIFTDCIPFLNVNKLPNIVPYISQLVTYTPFFCKNIDYYTNKEHRLSHNLAIVEKNNVRVSRLKPSIISMDGHIGDNFGNVPHFLKDHVSDVLRLKWFPESYIKIYLKQYNNIVLETTDPKVEDDVAGMYHSLQSISSCLIEPDIHFFEAICKTKSSAN